MENKESMVEILFEKTGEFAKKGVELYKLKAIDKSADVLSSLVARLTVIIILTLFFLIFNIGIALWAGEALGKSYYGFFSVAGFYALIGILLYAFRHQWIKEPIRNSIIEQALK